MAKKQEKDENIFEKKKHSFADELKLKIADKIIHLLSDLVDKSVMLSATRIRNKIYEIECALIDLVKNVVFVYIMKILILLLGLILIVIGAIKYAAIYISQPLIYLIVGAIVLIIGLVIKPKPQLYKRFK